METEEKEKKFRKVVTEAVNQEDGVKIRKLVKVVERAYKNDPSKLEKYFINSNPYVAGIASSAFFALTGNMSHIQELEYGGLGLELESRKNQFLYSNAAKVVGEKSVNQTRYEVRDLIEDTEFPTVLRGELLRLFTEKTFERTEQIFKGYEGSGGRLLFAHSPILEDILMEEDLELAKLPDFQKPEFISLLPEETHTLIPAIIIRAPYSQHRSDYTGWGIFSRDSMPKGHERLDKQKLEGMNPAFITNFKTIYEIAEKELKLSIEGDNVEITYENTELLKIPKRTISYARGKINLDQIRIAEFNRFGLPTIVTSRDFSRESRPCKNFAEYLNILPIYEELYPRESTQVEEMYLDQSNRPRPIARILGENEQEEKMPIFEPYIGIELEGCYGVDRALDNTLMEARNLPFSLIEVYKYKEVPLFGFGRPHSMVNLRHIIVKRKGS